MTAYSEIIVVYLSLEDGLIRFAGRKSELVALNDILESARYGRGSIALLAGEPGIGKTRLAEELSANAQRQGFLVMWGRCHEGDGAPSYWPWIQILRTYVQTRDPEVLRAELRSGAADLVTLVPDIQERLPEIEPAAPIDGAQARFRLFDSLTNALVRVSSTQPLMLVFDDLHWADISSLLLLRHIAHELSASRLLIIGTYRESDIDDLHPLTEVIADLARLDTTRQLPLSGLSSDQVVRLITATTGSAPSAALLSTMMEATAGNPFFVTQVLRLLTPPVGDEQPVDGSDRLITIPPGVRAVILQRFQHLSSSCRTLLQAAAVIGRECSLQLLRHLSLGAQDSILDALDEASHAQLLVPAPSGIGRYRFVHALVRETLYESLPLAERLRLHDRVGRALQTFTNVESVEQLAELSYHFFQAAPRGDAALALDYSMRTAVQSSSLLAYEDAALHYSRALQLLGLLTIDDPSQRCDLLLALGEAYAHSGAATQARMAFMQAVTRARHNVDAPHLAQAALGFAGTVVTPGIVDEQVVAFLSEALAALDDTDSVLRVRLLGRRAMEYRYSRLGEARDADSAAAVAIARRLSDPAALALALQARHYTLLAPDTLDQRMAISIELNHLADSTGNHELLLQSIPWRVADLLDLGHIHAADRLLAEAAQLAADLRQPLYTWYVAMFRAQRALMRGDMANGERLAEEAHTLGRQVQPSASQIYYTAQLFARRREQGRLPEMVPLFTEILERYPGMPIFRCWLALAYLQAGQADAAASLLAKLCADHCATLPWDQLWLGAIATLAELAVAIHDRTTAALLYELLLPFGGRNVMVGVPISLGAVALYLGELAACCGDHLAAERHYADAIRLHRQLEMRLFLARTQVTYAIFLQNIQQTERAATLLHEARTIVDAQEAPMLAAQLASASELRSGAQGVPAHSLTERELATLRLIAQGETTKAIAQALVISVATVERHITQLYIKIGVRSRAEATAFALRHGLL